MQIRFFHIPKTAGTSFSAILKDIYGHPWFHCTWDMVGDRKRFLELSVDERQKLVGVDGHSPLTTEIPAIDALPTVTFLRDPVARVKSFCQHVSEGKSRYLLDDFPPESFELDKFLDSGNAELSNLQTKMILGHGTILQDIAETGGSAAEEACERLFSRCICVGLQEEFRLSLARIQRALEWKRIPTPKRLNTASKHRIHNFTTSQIQTMRDLNGQDLKLYELVRKRIHSDTHFRDRALTILRRCRS